MEKEKPSFQNILHLFIQPTEGEPISFKLDLAEISKLIICISFVFLFLFWGTLFFFRELEINRNLQNEVLETKLQLQLKVLSEPQNTSPNRQLGYAITLTEDEGLAKDTTGTERVNNTAINTPEQGSWIPLPGAIVSARLGSLSSECQADNCAVKIELLPAGNGVSQGELLLILETEVPRIGTRGVTTLQRKQFIFYPGYASRNEFNSTDLSGFEKRPFKFSRTLNASVNFKVTKLLRPLALNVYLFDTRKTLIHHERKVIDLDESYAN